MSAMKKKKKQNVVRAKSGGQGKTGEKKNSSEYGRLGEVNQKKKTVQTQLRSGRGKDGAQTLGVQRQDVTSKGLGGRGHRGAKGAQTAVLWSSQPWNEGEQWVNSVKPVLKRNCYCDREMSSVCYDSATLLISTQNIHRVESRKEKKKGGTKSNLKPKQAAAAEEQ